MPKQRRREAEVLQGVPKEASQRKQADQGREGGGGKQQRWGEESPEENITDLYVMRNFRIAGEYKIGRSKCIQQRRGDLQESQNFQMVLVATFPRMGWAEALVHHRLAYSRVRVGPGREWFAAPLSEILFAVGRALEGA